MFSIAKNFKYKILTPYGFCDFDGVGKYNKKIQLKIIFEDNSNICCSLNHIFIVNEEEIRAENLKINDSLDGKDFKKKIKSIEKIKRDYLFDALEVKNNNNSYFTNGVISHNCQFLGSSSTLIDADTIERIDTIDPIEMRMNDHLSIYEKPIPNKLYFLGVDSAKGTGLDFSVIQVLKFNSDTSVEQVAVYRNDKLNTHDFAEVCIAVSKYYNNAMMMIENNDVGESVVNTIWYEYEYDYICQEDPKGIGIRSTKTTKLNACINLKRYLEEKWLKLNDKDTLYELARFVEVKPNIFQAETNCNDDTITALFWGLYVVKTIHYEGKISNKIQKNYDLNKTDMENKSSEEPPVIIFDEGDSSSEVNDFNYRSSLI